MPVEAHEVHLLDEPQNQYDGAEPSKPKGVEAMNIHEVKEWRESYEELLQTVDPRRFEIRLNDRGYLSGDQIKINEVLVTDTETLATEPTGNWCKFLITRVHESPRLRPGHVVLQLSQLLVPSEEHVNDMVEITPVGLAALDEIDGAPATAPREEMIDWRAPKIKHAQIA